MTMDRDALVERVAEVAICAEDFDTIVARQNEPPNMAPEIRAAIARYEAKLAAAIRNSGATP